MGWLSWLVTVKHPDASVARRGRLLAIILVAIISMLLVLMLFAFVTPNPVASFGSSFSSLIIELIALWLVRSGRVTAAGWFFIVTAVVTTLGSVAFGQTITPVLPLFFLILVVVAAGVVLPPRHIWGVLALNLATCLVALALIPNAMQDTETVIMLFCAVLIITATTVISFLGANAIQKALTLAEANARDASQARLIAEEQARDLAAQAATLRHTEQQLNNLVATLETPTVALADGVMLAPLVGALDSRRASALMERLLQYVAAQGIRLLVLDVAGVALIDTSVAQTLIRIVQALRLLGCEVVITGIAPNVALTLNQLGINLAGIQTARSPQEVLATLAPR